jgi:hypothetical protein
VLEAQAEAVLVMLVQEGQEPQEHPILAVVVVEEGRIMALTELVPTAALA